MIFRVLLLWTVCLTFSVCAIHAQSNCKYTIEGKVYDLQSEEPLAYVKVLIKGTALGTLTDDEGHFEFNNICEKENDLVFSYIGYKSKIHHHDYHHPFINIYLAPDTLVLSSVVVEAKRTESDLSTMTSVKIDPEQLSSPSFESLGDITSQIAGINMLRTGQNIVKPVIHGLHSNRILVINNGVRHEFQNWGIEHAPEIDPSLISSIEVIKGASTVRFGPDALGGVILINSPELELSSPFEGNVRVIGKSNGQSGEGSVELKKGFQWVSLLAGGSHQIQGDLHAPEYQLTNTGKTETSYYGGLRLHPLPELDIEGFYSFFDQTLGILSGSVFGNLEDLQRAIESEEPLFTDSFSYDIDPPKQEVSHELVKAKASYAGEKHLLTLQYGYQFNHRQEFGVRRTDAPNIKLDLITQSVDVDWVHPSIGPLSGKIGAQWQYQDNENLPGTNTVPFIPNYESTRYGAYLIEALEMGDNTWEIGIRYDYMEADITGREPDNTIYRNTIVYNNVSGTLGFKRQLSEYATLQSNFGTAWRPPNVAELYRFGQHAFFLEYGLWRYTIDERFDVVSTSQGILDESDREVPSEVGYKWINTYSIRKPDFQLEITGYINYIQNYIYSKPAGITRTPRGFFVFFIYDQSDALFWGIDVSTEWEHNLRFNSTLKASYLWAQQLNPKDNFAQQPPAKIDYQLAYTPSIPFFSETKFTIDASYTFEQFQHPRIINVEEFLFAHQEGIDRFKEDASDFDILAPPPGYVLTNLGWKASKGKFTWQVQFNNIFNVSYRNYTDRLRYFADDLGRNLILSMEYAW